MNRLLNTILAIMLSFTATAQSVSLAKNVPAGSKVFVSSSQNGIARYAAKQLKAWGYWAIQNDKNTADYTINFIISNGNITKRGAYAEITGRKNEVVYSIKPVNSEFSSWFGGSLFNKKRAAVKKLIKMRIIAGRE